MASHVRAGDVVVGLLTENTTQMLTQAVRLLRSIRWFGGELARARVVVCGVGPLASGARATLEALGAEIRTVSRFHPASPTGNRHQLIAELIDAPQEILFLLDCDTIVVRDPLPFLNAEAFQARIAPTPTVSDEVFERLFAHFGLVKPPRSYIAPFSGAPTIAYFNAGVFAIPRSLARILAPAWRKYNLVLAEHPELAAPCQRHMHQASLSLALVETAIPFVELPAAMNFQVNATHVVAPPGFAETDPVIIHYHHKATEDGFLLPCPYPAAQARIEMFHERMRAEGHVQEPVEEGRAMGVGESRPVVVVGMHRSGTSVVAQLLSAMGIYAGRPDELIPADIYNPTGYWEHSEVVRIDRDIFKALAASWMNVSSADVSRLSDEQRAGFVARARRATQSLQGHGAFLLKDPRMSVLLPLWRDALESPVFVIVWRDPMAVARSVATRDQRPLVFSIAAWDHYNRTLLRDTEGIPRVLVSYEDLLADPMRVARVLLDGLTACGIKGLRVPTEERLTQIVNPDFNRSGRGLTTDETLLEPEQRSLLAGLRSGAALRGPVEPTAPRTLALLAVFAEVEALQQRITDLDLLLRERDQLLSAVFESRSWRVGHGLTGLLRSLRRSNDVSAVDRWQDMKRGGSP